MKGLKPHQQLGTSLHLRHNVFSLNQVLIHMRYLRGTLNQRLASRWENAPMLAPNSLSPLGRPDNPAPYQGRYKKSVLCQEGIIAAAELCAPGQGTRFWSSTPDLIATAHTTVLLSPICLYLFLPPFFFSSWAFQGKDCKLLCSTGSGCDFPGSAKNKCC